MRLYNTVVACALTALIHCLTHIYGAASVFGVYSDVEFVAPWPWWTFQTLMRIEEIAMCILVFTLAGKARKLSGLSNNRLYKVISKPFVCVWNRIRGRHNQVSPSRESLWQKRGGDDVNRASPGDLSLSMAGTQNFSLSAPEQENTRLSPHITFST